MPDDPLESDIIERLLNGRPASTLPLQVDAGDDAAVLANGSALCNDVLVEGVHFDDHISAEDLGWKCVAVNVSDIAAMGGEPTWAMLGLSVPQGTSSNWIRDFTKGLHAALSRWDIHLIGGDTTRSPGPKFVSISMGGVCDTPVVRSKALPGDDIWVTGLLGTAAQGFFHGGPALSALHRPDPPVEMGLALSKLDGVHAMMDISDGLHRDLNRLCTASQVGAMVNAEDLPGSEWLTSGPDRLALQVAFGEDYQLLFTAAPDCAKSVKELGHQHHVRVTRVGLIRAEAGVHLSDRSWPPSLFEHFYRETVS